MFKRLVGYIIRRMKDLATRLNKQKQENRYRHRVIVNSPQGVNLQINGKSYLNFSSNDYLGLANHPRVVEALQKGAQRYGVGSGAAHLIVGHSSIHHDLEQALAAHVGRSRALLFSTGYMANIGTITALCGRADLVLEDRLNHASLIDGGLYSQADFIRYGHGDMHALGRALEKSKAQRRLIVTDGVFSMDGDIAPMGDIMRLSKQYHADVLVDDAHGLGVLGERGGGVCELYQLNKDDQPIIMGTLGKAFGVFGAFVAGSDVLIEWLIQQARTYVYTTAIPPAIAAASMASLALVQTQAERREKLQALVQQFRTGAENLGLLLKPSVTPIQAVVLGEESKALHWSEKLAEQGLMVKAIRPPTVPKGTSRLRITFSADHQSQDVSRLLRALGDLR